MPGPLELTLSLTEAQQFRRLVAFVREVDEHADEECDVALQALVHTLHDDLRDMHGGE